MWLGFKVEVRIGAWLGFKVEGGLGGVAWKIAFYECLVSYEFPRDFKSL